MLQCVSVYFPIPERRKYKITGHNERNGLKWCRLSASVGAAAARGRHRTRLLGPVGAPPAVSSVLVEKAEVFISPLQALLLLLALCAARHGESCPLAVSRTETVYTSAQQGCYHTSPSSAAYGVVLQLRFLLSLTTSYAHSNGCSSTRNVPGVSALAPVAPATPTPGVPRRGGPRGPLRPLGT